MTEEMPRLLVVDDEFGIREGIRKILEPEGFEVVTAEDGLVGWKTWQEQRPFSAALVDLKMPGMSGIELVQRLRAEDEDIVLIIITAHATIDTAVEGTKRGAYSYLPKPFMPDELLLTLRNGLDRRALAIEARRLREERERRLLEVAAERSKSNTIIRCMTDGILVANVEGQIVLRNTAAGHILPDLAGLPLPCALETVRCEEVRALIGQVLAAGVGPQIVSREITLERSTYMVNVSPVIEPDGETSGAVAVFRDITALKKLETAKSMFVSMVAHEIKSPLAAAEGYLNLILTGLVKHEPEEERRMVQRSLVRIRTLRTMVSELINLTAVETGNFTIRRSLIDIGCVVREVVDAYRERAEEKRIALSLCGAETGCMERALADKEALTAIYGNLVENAIKYTPEGGRVEVRVDQDGMFVRVAVRDTGIGLSAEEKRNLFQEFYRAKNEHTADIPGTGLGLSLVKRLTELHQGKVSVESEPGRGSEFAVSIPLHA